VKKSDIDTFELYLDSYLKVLKKFRQNNKRYKSGKSAEVKKVRVESRENKKMNSSIINNSSLNSGSKNLSNEKNYTKNFVKYKDNSNNQVIYNNKSQFLNSTKNLTTLNRSNIFISNSSKNEKIEKIKDNTKINMHGKNKTENTYTSNSKIVQAKNKNNISTSILHSLNRTNELKIKNSTHKINNYNFTKKILNHTDNRESSIYNNSSLILTNFTLNSSYTGNLGNSSQFKNSSSLPLLENKNNFTEKINEFLLGSDYKNKTVTSPSLTDYLENISKNNEKNKTEEKSESKNIGGEKNSSIKVLVNSSSLNLSSKQSNNLKIPSTKNLLKRSKESNSLKLKSEKKPTTKIVKKYVNNSTPKKKKNSRFTRSFLSNPEEIDKIYQDLKKKKLNEEFDRREKQTEVMNLEKKSPKYIDTESIENNIYKRIINISLSLIVIGLLMGILIGLIVVMYFSTQKINK
jgi:hypothetical protein